MIYKTALSEDARQHIADIGTADLLIGIPSFNNAATIGHVVKTAAEGAVRHFPELKTVIFNSDGRSEDDTRRVALETSVPKGVSVVAAPYQGPPGKGSAFRAVFEAARDLGVRACVVVDSDLRSIMPDWIERLAGPVLSDAYGYVTPYYTRHKYDGTITNNIAYPLTRALYGVRVRQPIGGDFGFSGALACSYLEKDVWETDVARFGIDIWMTTTAINEGFKVCQSRLGAKIHDAKDPAASLGPMFTQVVGSLFALMGTYEANWRTVQRSTPAELYGSEMQVETEPINVTLHAMIDRLKEGAARYGALWERILASENMAALQQVSYLTYDVYAFPVPLWVKCVYDFAVAYNKGVEGVTADELVSAMTPLYYGRTASFVVETQEMTTREAELIIEAQARSFERLKPYLLARWGS